MGSDWYAVQRVLGRLGWGLGALALAVTALLAFLIWRRRSHARP